jgi:hypothetical protein
MAKNTSLSSMRCLVNAAMRIERILRRRKDGVEFRLANIGVEPIYPFQDRVAIYGKAVRSETHEFAYNLLIDRVGIMEKRITIFLMLSPEFQMAITLPGMVSLVPVGDLCKERSWIFCQWMEPESVDDDRNYLTPMLASEMPRIKLA